MLGEHLRRGLEQLAAQPLGKADPLALHVGAGLAPQRNGFGVIAKLDADFLEHGVGIALDQRQPFLVQHFVIAELSQDERHRLAGAAARSLRTPRRSAPAAPSGTRLGCCILNQFGGGERIWMSHRMPACFATAHHHAGYPMLAKTMPGTFLNAPSLGAAGIPGAAGILRKRHPVAFSGMRVAFKELFANNHL
jgi:hypothetical protein